MGEGNKYENVYSPFHMLLIEIANTLVLQTDNPGGSWLEHNKKYSQKQGRKPSGAPKSFGSITGYFDRKVLIPVALLATAKGINGEQMNVRQDSLDWLHKEMGYKKRLPLFNELRQHAPFIQVDQEGVPWVNEGNHRIMVAAQLGWKFMPTEVRYFNGGELIPGNFAPAKLIQYDQQAQAQLFKADNDFSAEPST